MDLIYAAGLVSNKSRTATAPVALLERMHNVDYFSENCDMY